MIGMDALKALDTVLGSRKETLMFLNEAFNSFGLQGPPKFFEFLCHCFDNDRRAIWHYLKEAQDPELVASILVEIFGVDQVGENVMRFLRFSLYNDEAERFFETHISDYLGR